MIDACINIDILTHIHAYTLTRVHTHIHTHTYTHKHTHIQTQHSHMHACMINSQEWLHKVLILLYIVPWNCWLSCPKEPTKGYPTCCLYHGSVLSVFQIVVMHHRMSRLIGSFPYCCFLALFHISWCYEGYWCTAVDAALGWMDHWLLQYAGIDLTVAR